MLEQSICEASRALRLAAVLVFLCGMHPSVGLGAETGRPEIAAETARVIVLASARSNLSRSRGARSRASDRESAPRVRAELTPDEQRRSGIWTGEQIDEWREKLLAEGESSTRSEAGTRPDSNASDATLSQSTRSQIRPAPAMAATNGAASQAWLRSAPKVLWLVWLPWFLVPAVLLSASYILIRIIWVGATGSGRSAPPAQNAIISRVMQTSKVELLPSPPARMKVRDAAALAPGPVHAVAVNLPEFEDPTPRGAAGVIVDFPPVRGIPQANPPTRDYQVLTIANNKGGIGKTALAVNLAVDIRALREDMPILLISFDDQSLPDRMFGLDCDPPGGTVVNGMLEGSFASMIRTGQYGIEYVPSDPDVGALKRSIQSPLRLRSVLDQTGYKGLVIVDTKSDLEILTQNAIEASDLTIVPVADEESLLESEKVYKLLEQWQRPHERARIALTLIDLRVRYGKGSHYDILSLLLSEIRDRGLPLFQSFISRSPKIQSLHTNPDGVIVPILVGAPASLIHRQMLQLTEEALASLDAMATALVSRTVSEPRKVDSDNQGQQAADGLGDLGLDVINAPPPSRHYA